MRHSEQLISSAKNIFGEFYTHPFVRGIIDGTLDKDKFQYYMIQDYLYLIDYAKVFSVGAAKAEDPETMELFSGYAYQILHGEMNIHRGYMKRLGISPEEAECTPLALDNLSYTSYMLRIAYEGGAAETAAAILSCAVSYEYIGREILRQNPKADAHEFYGEWVRGYTSEEYAAENRMLEDLLDRLTDQSGNDQMRRLEQIFINCSRYELGFWDMGWNKKK